MKTPAGSPAAGYGYIKHGHGSQSTPTMHGAAGFEAIEAQISSGEEFGQHDDLTGVLFPQTLLTHRCAANLRSAQLRERK